MSVPCDDCTLCVGGGQDLGVAVATLPSTGGRVCISGPTVVSSTLSLGYHIEVHVGPEGRISVASGATLTVNGSFVADRQPIFTGEGTAVLPGAEPVYPEWFGAIAYATQSEALAGGAFNSAPALQKALDAVAPAGTTDPGSRGTRMSLARGVYRSEARLIIRRGLVLEGVSGAGWYGGSTLLAVNTGAISIQQYPANADSGDGAWSVIRDLALVGTSMGDDLDEGDTLLIDAKHGVRLHARAELERLYITGFKNGAGVAIMAGDNPFTLVNGYAGNANCSKARDLRIDNCGSGLYVKGGDANACLFEGVDATANRFYGVVDRSFLGNTYVGCHTEANPRGGYEAVTPIGQGVLFVGCYAEGSQGSARPTAEQGNVRLMAPSRWIHGNPGEPVPGSPQFSADSSGCYDRQHGDGTTMYGSYSFTGNKAGYPYLEVGSRPGSGTPSAYSFGVGGSNRTMQMLQDDYTRMWIFQQRYGGTAYQITTAETASVPGFSLLEGGRLYLTAYYRGDGGQYYSKQSYQWQHTAPLSTAGYMGDTVYPGNSNGQSQPTGWHKTDATTWTPLPRIPRRNTASWNPPSLAAGAVQSTTVTVAGAALGDVVVVAFTVGLLGTQLWGEVTAADTVTVYQRNPTAAAKDVAAGTLRVEVQPWAG